MSLPEPMTPADCDLRGMAFMPLDVVRLVDSDLMALASGEAFKAAVTLWCKAWLQIPAASLPNDDRVLAHLSGLGSRWKRLKPMALHGFILCGDDRWYHPVIAEKAIEAFGRRGRFTEKRTQDRARLRNWRARKRAPDAEEEAEETRFAGEDETREERGTGDRDSAAEKSAASAKRASRLPADFAMPADWIAWAQDERGWSDADARTEGASFTDYWHAKSGRDATKLDWQATWRNWVRNSRRQPGRRDQAERLTL
ncbi:DUF1376 domain-containing protein [Sphingomonas oleivorans]|uniref:DUF1376 domain-containing protein n=1 Tax=Sphingomonas oleivorans TaxID=1735121 RepID=UPI001A9F6E75|nr:DUF1376 domain-containing protein [Sphingomonas oleivorans]